MSAFNRLSPLLVLAFVGGCAPDSEKVTAPTSPDTALAAITTNELQAHVEYLASDEMQGRMTGTAAYVTAANYVANEFEALGLTPGGEDNTWFQEVPLLANRIDVDSASVTLHQDSGDSGLKWKEDFLMAGDNVRDETFVRGEVVYVGYGIHAPDIGYSDYEGIDVNGKIIAIFSGAPDTFDHNERAYYSSSRTKSQEMVKRGAIGSISLQSRLRQKQYPWKRLTMNAGRRPGMAWVNLSGEAADFNPELLGAATLSVDAATALFDTTPISFEQALDAAEKGQPRSTALGVEVSLSRKTHHEHTTSPNVIGILPGSDPELRSQYVVYSAHLDHVGTGAPVDGDDIYNGAYDNAMGVSLMIEAARAFAAMEQPPKRSIMFIALTGEERGLLGSDYFAHYPTVPHSALTANVNLDMPLFLYPVADIIAFGAEHTTLGTTIDSAIAAENFTLTPDPIPEEVIFIRSDQYSFVRQGVPSVYLIPGFSSTDAEIDGEKAFRDHLATHYHQPSDDMSRPFDWPSVLRFARANVRIGLAVANEEREPTWLPGDFFGEKFGRNRLRKSDTD
ncbi:MAG: M28 family metallopeptidase [Woeseia sp.]